MLRCDSRVNEVWSTRHWRVDQTPLARGSNSFLKLALESMYIVVYNRFRTYGHWRSAYKHWNLRWKARTPLCNGRFRTYGHWRSAYKHDQPSLTRGSTLINTWINPRQRVDRHLSTRGSTLVNAWIDSYQRVDQPSSTRGSTLINALMNRRQRVDRHKKK